MSPEPSADWELVTVSARFRGRDGRRAPTEAELDALVDVLIARDEVATVRVHPEGSVVVYRVDVRAADTAEAERLAVLPAQAAQDRLGLVAAVDTVTARAGSSPG